MAKLEVLDAYNNNFSGLLPRFVNLNQLEYLSLGGNYFSYEIPSSYSELQRHHPFDFWPAKAFGTSAWSQLITSLRELDVALNGLTGRIPKCFSQLKQRGVLNLFENKIDGSIPGSIGELPNLSWLGLRSNNFDPELPQNLGQSGNLRVLDVNNYKISSSIPRQLCKGGKLKWLSLTNNSFSGSINQELGTCTSLARVRIDESALNGITSHGMLNLPLVEIVELNNNQLSRELPSTTTANSLQALNLGDGFITEGIPLSIRKLRKLQELFLGMNTLSAVIPVFPDQLFSLKNNISD